MRRPPLAVLAFGLAAFVMTSAEARTCWADAPPPAAQVAAPFWHDAAEFAFLIGRDLISENGSMTLARRLSGLDGFASLRQSAAGWDGLQSRLQTASARLAALSDITTSLQGHCDALDALALEPDAPFDSEAWLDGVAALERQIDSVIADTRPVVGELSRYDGLLRAAAKAYDNANHAPIPGIRIGPEPRDLASGMSELAARWRALLSDLENARAILPVTPELGSERPLIAITAAMTEMERVAAEARALSAGSLGPAETAHYLSGDYLYDQCPMISDRQWVQLESRYWTAEIGALALLGSGILIGQQAPAGSNAGVGSVANAPKWQFNRIGLGYWLIRNGGIDPQISGLDVINDAKRNYPLEMTKTNGAFPHFTGQYWRCTATENAGEVRLYNLFLSEARSMDTYRDQPLAIMSSTGNFNAQYWFVRPATVP